MAKRLFKIALLCFFLSIAFAGLTVASMGKFGMKGGPWSTYFAFLSIGLFYPLSLIVNSTSVYLARRERNFLRGPVILLVVQLGLGIYMAIATSVL